MFCGHKKRCPSWAWTGIDWRETGERATWSDAAQICARCYRKAGMISGLAGDNSLPITQWACAWLKTFCSHCAECHCNDSTASTSHFSLSACLSASLSVSFCVSFDSLSKCVWVRLNMNDLSIARRTRLQLRLNSPVELYSHFL